MSRYLKRKGTGLQMEVSESEAALLSTLRNIEDRVPLMRAMEANPLVANTRQLPIERGKLQQDIALADQLICRTFPNFYPHLAQSVTQKIFKTA